MRRLEEKSKRGKRREERKEGRRVKRKKREERREKRKKREKREERKGEKREKREKREERRRGSTLTFWFEGLISKCVVGCNGWPSAHWGPYPSSPLLSKPWLSPG